MNIECAGLSKATVLNITYPDYSEHLKRTKIHNDGQQKSERNKKRVVEHKRKKDKSSDNHRKVDSNLRLSLIDGSTEYDSTLRPFTFEGLREFLPKVGVIFLSKPVQGDDPLGR